MWNKINKIEDLSKNENTKNFVDIFSKEIWKILSEADDNITDKIDYVFKKFLKLVSISDLQDPKIQKRIFNQIFEFLNSLFSKIDIKKFYNNIPKTDIKHYNDKTIWEMFLHNIYWKERKLFYKDEVEWWSCSYWTVLFKHFFDELEKKWMNIKSDIFFYPVNDKNWGRWHSGVIVTFQGKDYLVDFWWFNVHFNDKIIEDICILNKKYWNNWFNCFKRGNIEKYYKTKWKKDKKLMFFHDTETFTTRWMERSRNNATIELKPNLDFEWSKEVKLSFYSDRIILNIQDKMITFFLDEKKLKNNNIISDENIFDLLLSSIVKQSSVSTISGFKSNKQELEKYLSLVRSKINIQNLRKIYWFNTY